MRRLLARIEHAVTTPLPARGLGLHRAAALAAEIEAPGRDLLALGGKRWRPLLLALSCRMCGGAEDAAVALAPVVELAHNGSLIIDDIEDGADLRRGAPAAHLRHGLDLAINAGNLLYFLPAAYLAAAGLDTAVELQVHRLYGAAMLRLHYGQELDILWHREPERMPAIPEYFAMCRAKSGSLAGLAAALGATAARAPEAVVTLLGDAGEEFGVCFQIIDDVRNLTTGNPGKRRGDDLVEGKKSLPVILYCNRDNASRRRMVALLKTCSAADSVEAAGDAVEQAIALMNEAGAIEEARTTARQQFRRVMGRLEAYSEPRHRRSLGGTAPPYGRSDRLTGLGKLKPPGFPPTHSALNGRPPRTCRRKRSHDGDPGLPDFRHVEARTGQNRISLDRIRIDQNLRPRTRTTNEQPSRRQPRSFASASGGRVLFA